MQAALEHKLRLVAVGFASNALGTINPVPKIVEMAHAAGTLGYADAVQYAPHGPIDVALVSNSRLAHISRLLLTRLPHLDVIVRRAEKWRQVLSS